MAVKLRGVQCTSGGDDANNIKLAENDLFNGGCLTMSGETACWIYLDYLVDPQKAEDILLGHCKESQATMVFLFLSAVVLLGSGLTLFLRKRKGY
jgi:hypothetical protein